MSIKFEKDCLFEVVFEVRYNEILKISDQIPSAFQDEIRSEFPVYEEISIPSKIDFLQSKVSIDSKRFHRFFKQDKKSFISLSSASFSLTYLDYCGFDHLSKKIKWALSAFSKVYSNNSFLRVGLRYKNLFNETSMASIIEQDAHKKLKVVSLISTKVFPELNQKQKNKSFTASERFSSYNINDLKFNSVYSYGIMNGCYKGKNFNNQESFIIDLDCFSEKFLTLEDIVKSLKSLKLNIQNSFEGSISHELAALLKPRAKRKR